MSYPYVANLDCDVVNGKPKHGILSRYLKLEGVESGIS